MIDLMNSSLEHGKSLIDSELDTGLLDIIIKPIIKTFYNYWSKNDAKVGTLEQISLTLDCGKRLVNNGLDSTVTLEKLVDENFPKYLKSDQLHHYCHHKHKNFNKVKEIARDSFISQIEESVILLKVKDDVSSYDDLVRSAFKTKEEAYVTLVKQLDFYDESIKIIENDTSILKLPTGKKILIKVLRRGFEETRQNLESNLDNIY
jgi:hypothetical protein